MAQARRDRNFIPTSLAVSSSDGTTPLNLEITAATGRLRTDVGDGTATLAMSSGGAAKVGLYASDDTALSHSGGNLLVNVQNFAIGAFGDSDAMASNLTSGMMFGEMFAYDSASGGWDRVRLDPVTSSLQTVDYPHHEIHSGNHYYLEGHATLGDGGILRVRLITPDTTKWGHFLWDIGSSGILTTNFYEGASGGMANGSRAVIHANNRNVNCWTGSHTGGDDEATVLTDSTQAWTIDALIGLQVFNETDASSGIITDNDATSVTVAALAGGTGNDWDTDDKYEINNSQMVIEKGVDVATDVGVLISSSSWGDKKLGGGGQARTDELILKQNTTYYRIFVSGAASNIVAFKASWYEHTNH